MSGNSLPRGWAETTLKVVAGHHSGNSKLIKGKLHPEPAEGRYPGFSATGQDVWLDGYEHEGNAIIISAVGARCGKCFLTTGKWSAIANTHIVWPDEGAVESRFLWYLLNDETFWIRGGTAQPFVKTKASFDKAMVLPPLREQSRIVDKLDELLSDLDKGVEALERVRRNLERYRASVLKAAVEGRLTEEWRAEHPDVEPASELLKRILAERRRRWEEAELAKYEAKGRKPSNDWKDRYKEPAPPDTTGLPELPEGWVWATMPQVGDMDRGRSRHRPRNDPKLYGGDYPFIQTGDIRSAEQYVREHKQSYNDAGLAQSRLWPKETLCITIAANIADTAILSYPACFPDSVVGVNFDDRHLSVRYVEFFFRTAQQNLETYAPATAQKNINLAVLRDVCVPLAPRLEQEAIVDRTEAALSVASSAESTIAERLSHARRLRQSILKVAFEGRLVPQDPNDEPASVLLERIRAVKLCANESSSRKRGPAGKTRRRPGRRGKRR